MTARVELDAAARPGGTVTFLLTDIEGSTRNWEASPLEMRAALARHDELLNSLIWRHGGRVLTERGEGDSFFAVFGRASDAAAAATAVQLALTHEKWPAGAPIKVRMAIHTGEAEGDYRGQDVNRCARLRAVAHGGQVLLSSTSAALVANNLPVGGSLADLHLHRLRDLEAPEHVYQLNNLELPATFPPLRSLDGRRQNLPLQLTTFVGRESEIEQLKEHLSKTRLLTITGAGGSGKTRLSLQLAAEAADAYPDGVWFVDLSETSDVVQIERGIARALEVREQPGEQLRSTLIANLAERQLLLVLDNCEQVIQDVAKLTHAIVAATSGVTIIATSREALGVPGEVKWVIPSLSVPAEGIPAPGADLQRFESIRLFVDRALAVQPSFVLDTETGAAVASICRRLDGLPLAIELAASRTQLLGPTQILSRLDDRFRLLTGGARVALPRQKTLRAAVDWSHDLLAEPEQILFRRLAVFAGGFDLAAAEAVCADEELPVDHVLDELTALVDKSLVAVETRTALAGRYRLQETLREYGQEKLVEAAEDSSARTRHLGYFTELAEQAYASAGRDEPTVVWLDRLELENENVRAALAWARANEPTTFLQLCGALAGLWWLSARHLREAREWLTAALNVPAPNGPMLARALSGASLLASWQGDPATAKPLAERGIAEWQEARGSAADLSAAHEALGWANVMSGNDSAALISMERSLDSARRGAGERVENRATLSICQCLVNLDRVAEVTALATEALEQARRLNEPRDIHLALHFLADAGLASGAVESAEALYRESLRATLAYGNTLQAGMEVQGAAMALAGLGQSASAVRLNAGAQQWLHAGGMYSEQVPFWARYLHRYMDPAREQLGPAAVAELEEEGRARSFDAAIDEVLGVGRD